MKITIKPLKGETFEVEIDEAESVKALKAKIAEVKADLEATATKTIHSGKILTDDLIIKDCNIKAGEFVVVMSTKPKAEPKPAPTPPPATETTTATTTPTTAMEQAAATLVTGAGSEAAITQLCGMGFERPDVERCLRAAFGNPDRAVEYLMNGIPESLTNPEAEGDTGDAPMPPGSAPPTAPTTGGASPYPAAPTSGMSPFPAMPTGGTTPTGATSDMMAELRNLPRFAELAQMITQNPAVLAQVLPALQQSHPALAEAIRANPEEFMRALQEGARPADPVATMLRAAQQGMPPGGGRGGPPPGTQVVRLSEEEQAAVARLEALGFERNMAAQAYFACDKNEEMAANLLLSDSMQD